MQPREGGPDDVELIRGIVDGNPDAMAALFDRHAPGVLAVCLHVLRDRSDAEDVLENVFFELWQHPDRFDAARGSARTYLEILARSRALDLVRSRARGEKRDREVEQIGAFGGRDRTEAAPLSRLLDRERRQALQKAVDDLGPTQRQVIELAFFRGLTHTQVAEVLDLPLGTVKSRIRSGLHLLRRLLGSENSPGRGAS